MAYLPGMKYRRFGRTEIRMPVISCGGMRYQYKWQDVDPAATSLVTLGIARHSHQSMYDDRIGANVLVHRSRLVCRLLVVRAGECHEA